MRRDPPLSAPSAPWLRAALPWLRRYTARHFSALRIAVDGGAPVLTGPTVFYSNHPSWWDPIVLFLLIRSHYADWRFHGPIDSAALERYPWLERLGLFPVAPDSASGARRLLEAGAELLEGGRSGLVLTAQGRFADPRERPLVLKPGLARLLERNPEASALPIAIEYVFWNERLPEILVRFGTTPVAANDLTRPALERELEAGLEREVERLGAQALARDAAAFRTLVDGRRGVGFVQDLPLRIRSWLGGRRFDPSHSAVGRDTG